MAKCNNIYIITLLGILTIHVLHKGPQGHKLGHTHIHIILPFWLMPETPYLGILYATPAAISLSYSLQYP